MKIKKEDISVMMEAPGTIMRNQKGFGNYTVAFNELPKGTDFTPLLKGLDHDLCHSPHMGYVFEGIMRIIYTDGSEELVTGGDVFYLPPGHTGIVEQDIKFVEFSPSQEFEEVMENVGKRMAEMGG